MPSSPYRFDVRDLWHRAGEMRETSRSFDVPEQLGASVATVPAGTPLTLDARFEGLHEGILVSGHVTTTAVGECVRCLTEVRVPVEVDVQELFVHDASREEGYEDEDEVSVLSGDYVDLQPVLRDDVVLDLPFQPLCRPDCAGLCPTCGVRLDDHPGHHHDDAVDARWAALGALDLDNVADAAPDGVEQGAPHPYNRPGPSQGGELSR